MNYTINKTGAFKNIYSNFLFCIKDNNTKDYLFGDNNISICLETCSNDNNKKISTFIDGCIKSCFNYGFEYEYKNVCYHECPNNTYSFSYDNDNIINDSKICFDQPPQGYYLDINENNYKKCYNNCKSCYGEGNETYNNCSECKDNYTFYNISENIMNCYPICRYYYYFNNSNKYVCTESKECPKEYNKLIADKNKCIDECKNDNIYKYKYENNNQCYQNCPENSSINETNNYTCIPMLINTENTSHVFQDSVSGSHITYECEKIDHLNNNCKFPNIKNEIEIIIII